MQVHAVPDSERWVDPVTGRKLPWAYEFADSDQSQRRVPEEKGPFGKARKRGSTRSKTATPARKEDQAKLENARVVDDIFVRHIAQEEKKRSIRRKPSGSLPVSASAPNLGEGGLASSFQAGASTNAAGAVREPTEVILYGYGSEVQWAVIDKFERVSGGFIYEEYDRLPPSAKFSASFGANKARDNYRSLSKSHLRKINEYVGGDHWIKVTFDSPESAERAIHYSPKTIQGFEVRAEHYRGQAPTVGDVAVRVGSDGARSLTASPNAPSSTTIPQSSATLSSATATGSHPASMPRLQSEPAFQRPAGGLFDDDNNNRLSALHPRDQALAPTQPSSSHQPGRNTLRVRGAKPAVLLPAEKAFLPAAPRWQNSVGNWPLIGWVVGSGHGFIGNAVPRREDGSFDVAGASLYWRFWYGVDTCLGTDFCGVRDAEYDE
ncbi:hypothetical protein BDV96DRAFT_490920 [Lophiotrema nucula]|uniref:Uncharacterized protein n=1 Tax=Lophiotrema nucula TaxID=690887 RepID=A0A6A5ZDW6_9PLEO|nr:hypothetical protein BDV96DRAFT_490920 [Lophiotrema nucula]